MNVPMSRQLDNCITAKESACVRATCLSNAVKHSFLAVSFCDLLPGFSL